MPSLFGFCGVATVHHGVLGVWYNDGLRRECLQWERIRIAAHF
jgi:hypothetical protein